MGIYINLPGMPHFGKAQFILDNIEEAVALDKPEDVAPNHVPVCVVTNPQFEAAGVAYSVEEVHDFASTDYGDQRPRTWVSVPRVWAMNEFPSYAEELAG